jgi:hypothetical protein
MTSYIILLIELRPQSKWPQIFIAVDWLFSIIHFANVVKKKTPSCHSQRFSSPPLLPPRPSPCAPTNVLATEHVVPTPKIRASVTYVVKPTTNLVHSTTCLPGQEPTVLFVRLNPPPLPTSPLTTHFQQHRPTPCICHGRAWVQHLNESHKNTVRT